MPTEKILSRYHKALKLIPELLKICDICHIYDNSDEPTRIFKKRKSEYFYWGLRKKLCKRYLTKLDKAKITGISLI